MAISRRLIILLALGFSQFLYASGAGQYALSTAHPIASQAGERILQEGGNAFDAAVAISATLAVVEPYSSGLGGGGFWLLQTADGKQVMIDGREKAPSKAHRDMYLKADGSVDAKASVDGARAAGIPGVPAALDHLAQKYGRLSLKQSLQPAIEAATNGFAVEAHYRRMASFRKPALLRGDAAATQFLFNGEVPPLGHIIKQPDLALTLEALAAQGRDGFYKGDIAKALLAGVHRGQGVWTLQDLADYRVVERAPIQFNYKDYRVTSVAPPSSGGVALAEILHILEAYDLSKMDQAQRIHIMVEAMRRAYRDRAEYLGDGDFVDVPVARLISTNYAAGLRASIRLDRATPSSALRPIPVEEEGPHTTHFSVVDGEGNRVSATLSVNYPFGSCYVPAGTGVVLNDEMDDFSAKPGTANVYGLVGAAANEIAPGKRPLSSMSPSFVDGPAGYAVIGTPGGSRIITMVLLGIVGYTEGLNANEIVALPRFHHQYLPDHIQYENNSLPDTVKADLQALGHELKEKSGTYGNMHVVLSNERGKTAAADPRGLGLSIVGKIKH